MVKCRASVESKERWQDESRLREVIRALLLQLSAYTLLIQYRPDNKWKRSVIAPDSAVCPLTVLLHGPGPIELKACIWTSYLVQGFRPSTVASLVPPPPSTSVVLASPWPSVLRTRSRYPTVSGLLLYSDSGSGWRATEWKEEEKYNMRYIVLFIVLQPYIRSCCRSGTFFVTMATVHTKQSSLSVCFWIKYTVHTQCK